MMSVPARTEIPGGRPETKLRAQDSIIITLNKIDDFISNSMIAIIFITDVDSVLRIRVYPPRYIQHNECDF